MTIQDRIMAEVCAKHNITVKEGEEVFSMFGKFIFTAIKETIPKGHVAVDSQKLKNIPIYQLGKIIPKGQRVIDLLNERRIITNGKSKLRK